MLYMKTNDHVALYFRQNQLEDKVYNAEKIIEDLKCAKGKTSRVCNNSRKSYNIIIVSNSIFQDNCTPVLRG